MERPAAGSGDHAGRAGGLELEGLSYARGARGSRGRAVLEDVSFSLARGRILAVVGPSGAGKSTLLSLIAGFQPATRGTIRLDGVTLDRQAPSERGVGMAFDDAALHEHLSVRGNLEAAASSLGEDARTRRARIESLAAALGIDTLLDRSPGAISAGERRRVALGRAFARKPSLALLDEPFANLDRPNRRAMRTLVRAMHDASGAATIVVSHDATDALAIADDLIVLIDGRVRACGTVRSIMDAPPDLEVAQLLDEDGMEWLELAPGSSAPRLPQALAARLRDLAEKRHDAEIRIGIRPTALRASSITRTGADDDLTLDGVVDGHEAAGCDCDLLVRIACGRIIRARVTVRAAQELPKHSAVRLSAAIGDVHLFVGPWPGRRMG